MNTPTWALVTGLLIASSLAGCPSSHEGTAADAAADVGIDARPDACRPALERCNNVDDDCDGVVDEDLCADGLLCVDGGCSCPLERSCTDDACVDTETSAEHCGGCGVVCSPGRGCAEGRCCSLRGDALDLLFVVDNSASLAQEQVAFARELPNLFRGLLEGDYDLDGLQDAPPITSLRVGIVTTDMGVGDTLVPTCEGRFGDDGVLQTVGNLAIEGCQASYPSFLEARAGTSPDTFAADVQCVSVMGTNGCGFEQQLDAMLKAVTPSSSPLRFNSGTTGHADGANAGLFRDDALLAIVHLSDENDCSAADSDVFNPASDRYPGDLNLRCVEHPEAIHAIERYVDGLIAARDPSRLIFGAIVGIPERLETLGDYDRILADDRMQEVVDPTMPTRVRPSCNRPGTGLAFPPRRFVELARDLGERGVGVELASICQDSYQLPIRKIAQAIGSRARRSCE